MKINTLTRYALRALIEISFADENNPVSIKELAKKQALSEKYLETIVAKLKKHKLVASKKGKFGGYYLNKKIENISLYEIFLAMEGELQLLPCIDVNRKCKNELNCKTQKVWDTLNKKIVLELNSIKLNKMI